MGRGVVGWERPCLQKEPWGENDEQDGRNQDRDKPRHGDARFLRFLLGRGRGWLGRGWKERGNTSGTRGTGRREGGRERGLEGAERARAYFSVY